MTEKTGAARRSRFVAIVTAIVTIVFGILFVVAWYLQSVFVLQWQPDNPLVAYTTSISLLIAGFGLLAVSCNFKRVALVSGTLISSLGVLVLAEQLLWAGMDVDNFLTRSFVPYTTLFQDMAPNTAACFILIGIALCLLSRSSYQKWHLSLVSFCASLAVGIGVVAICGYLANIEATYRWGFMTQMAVQTAIAISVLGVGVVAQAWSEEVSKSGVMPCWICLPFAVMLLTIVVSLWLGLKAGKGQTAANLPKIVLISGVMLTILFVWGLRLAQKLQTSATKLAEQAKALEYSNRSLQEFAHIAAHEFKTPLTVIKTAVENLSDGIFGSLNDGQSEMAKMISKNADMLYHITINLLNLAKLQAEQQQLEKQDVNLAQVAEDVLSSLRIIAGKKNIALYNHSSIQLPRVYVNADMVAEVLNNLITNALRYARQSIKVVAKEDGDCVCVDVEDDGPGIPKQNIDFMFGKFVQLGEQRKAAAYYGSGLGLAICRELVLRSGGKIWAESEEGKGAIFHFTLPKSSGSIVASDA